MEVIILTANVLTALPIFNEADHILPILDEVQKRAKNILLVDDGSTDRTPEVLASLEGIAVETHESNQGYGAALRTAFEYAIRNDFDVLVTIDCDGQHEPGLIPSIAQQLLESGADIVSGSRYMQVFDNDSVPPEDRRRINVQITEELNSQFGLELTDSFCGFKAYRVSALKHFNITELGYAMPLQLWVQAVCADLKVVEFPVPLVYLDEERSFGGSLDDSARRLNYYREVLQREVDALGDCVSNDLPDCVTC